MSKTKCPLKCELLAANEEDRQLIRIHDMADDIIPGEPAESIKWSSRMSRFRLLACDNKDGYKNCTRYVLHSSSNPSGGDSSSSGDNSSSSGSSSSSNGGCYIATCIYGSYDCSEVWTLRRFRDNTLESSRFGRQFIRLYYAVSPKIVGLFGNKKWFGKLWKPILDRVIVRLQKHDVDDGPYSDTKIQ